ncbi:CehA/McbA family metallohydrolase [Paenibacillus kyungheensis]|uniref:CehA/McbA family metallohydrolase n=1 Tax=Paenibacillus kyungheensis TaxID=1452732 RepID=A0AAX3M8G4_9BACL|nr:CehA/McbA family metallohydrolase [Paenibacillus kyungheensis]WCT57681.1 CehA/McbA family metallohydrolase [Paenibacillus kyungheensis]
MKWIPSELHTHTLHSDGQHTLDELVQSALHLGIDCIALTDHNTQSGLQDRQRIQHETGIHIIPGMEWTTFYGHMITMGIYKYVDWRNLGIHDIEKGIDQVHAQGGLVGIAHPFRIGSPICTGCYWEYPITNWQKVDYIEVWSTLMPSIKKDSQRAFAWWTSLLNEGHQITATSGRDWHRTEDHDAPAAITYIGTEDEEKLWHSLDILQTSDVSYTDRVELEPKDHSALTALRQGAVTVTMGPLLTFTAHIAHPIHDDQSKRYHIGQELYCPPHEKLKLEIALDTICRQQYYTLADQSLRLVVNSNRGILFEQQIPVQTEVYDCELEQTQVLSWVRVELYGYFAETYSMIAFTNAIYITHSL